MVEQLTMEEITNFMKSNHFSKQDEWTETLISLLSKSSKLLDFTSKGIEFTKKNKAQGGSYNFLRINSEGDYDRLYVEFDYNDISKYNNVELAEIQTSGWLIGVQYAFNSEFEECPIPCLESGGYCDLYDLSNYKQLDISSQGWYYLGTEDAEIMVSIRELVHFLKATLPIYIESEKL